RRPPAGAEPGPRRRLRPRPAGHELQPARPARRDPAGRAGKGSRVTATRPGDRYRADHIRTAVHREAAAAPPEVADGPAAPGRSGRRRLAALVLASGAAV